MQKTWDPPRVMAALRTLRDDNGVSVREMTRLSGANRSTIYRWMRDGEGQPEYALVNRLAQGIWYRWPDLARELVEASGWPWQEPGRPG
jgi:transcriptional regulator with XRE-family HTH domain